MKFSIGYNFDIKMLDLLERYPSHIEALYFPIPSTYLGSGRGCQQPESYARQIPRIIKKCTALNMKSQILLNPLYDGRSGLSNLFFNKIIRYLKQLQEGGLSSVVVVNPVYMSRVRKELPGMIIEASVNCFVRTLEHALYLKDLGADIITIDRDINHDLPRIKDIKNRTGLRIRMMLNEGCFSNCPYRVMHYNYLSEPQKRLSASFRRKDAMPSVFYDHFCTEIFQRDPLKIFRIPFIPPEKVAHYASVVDHCKLSTRAFSTERIEVCLKAYIHKHYSGNLLTLLDSPGLSFFEYVDYDTLKKNDFFRRMLACSLKCKSCLYCNALFEKAVVRMREPLQNVDRKEEELAVRVYRKELLKRGRGKQRGMNYLLIGKAYFRLSRYGEAIRSIKLGLKLRLNGLGTYLILGLCYEKLHQYAAAISSLKKEMKLSPNSRSAMSALARCYHKLGDQRLFNRYINRLRRVLLPHRPDGKAGVVSISGNGGYECPRGF